MVVVVVVVRISLHVSSQPCGRTVDFLKGPSVFTVFGGEFVLKFRILCFVAMPSTNKTGMLWLPETAKLSSPHLTLDGKGKKTLEAQNF